MKLKKITTVLGIKGALILAMGLLGGTVKSQLYGEYRYVPANYVMCSGSTGVNYPAEAGMVMAGANISGTSSNNHFMITRTSDGGLYMGNPWEFIKEYFIKYNPGGGCAAPSMAATSCIGVSVIETNPGGPPSDIHYAVAGSFHAGVFYAELDQFGTVLNTWFSKIPTTPSQLASKPVICESVINPGTYFVAGYQGGRLYAFKYNAGAAAPAPGRIYNSTSYCSPRAIIESPYNNNEVTIVGEAMGAGTLRDGFFLQLDRNSLAVITNGYKLYDYMNVDQKFNCIDIATSGNAGGKGFIIGGTTPVSASFQGTAWAIKLNVNGNYMGVFSTVLRCSTDPTAGGTMGIVERINTSGIPEYYGSLNSNNNQVIVAKLDDLGNPAGPNNEYIYFIGNNTKSVALSKINQPGFPDEGLQIFASDANATPNSFFFGQACFSGQSGCSKITNVQQFINITPNLQIPTLSILSNMTGCYNSSFILGIANPQINTQPCGNAPYNGPGSVGGNNARPAAATGLAHLNADATGMTVYPNPASSNIRVSLKASIGDNVKIELFDYLGRLVTSVPVIVTEGTQTTDINLSSLNIESGIYLISAKINGSASTQKIVYNKE